MDDISSVFAPLESADIFRCYPPFVGYIVIKNKQLSQENALAMWSWHHNKQNGHCPHELSRHHQHIMAECNAKVATTQVGSFAKPRKKNPKSRKSKTKT